MQLTGISGRTAIVTGAAGGIGKAVCLLLLEEGARVVACDTDLAGLAGIHGRWGHALRLETLDVRDSAAVDDLVDRVEEDGHEIAIAVNVAGVLATGLATETTDTDWRQVFAVNVDGVFHLSRAVARHMVGRGEGAIVTVSSNAAGVPRHGMAAYAASKAASTMFTRCLGLELGPHGIRCNVVAPGSTLTPMQTGMWADDSGAAKVIAGSLESFKTGIPLGKLATPEDVAAAVVFLLSDQAGHVTMADLYVDGGATQRA